MNCPNCKTEVDEHEANRCLDAWVAEAVFGAVLHDNGMWYTDAHGRELFSVESFSTDIAAAWEVVGLLLDNEFDLDYDNEYRCFFAGDNNFGLAPTAPLAICRAALKSA